jgi:hypothetical protein
LLAPSFRRPRSGNPEPHPLANINCHVSIVEIGWWVTVTRRSLSGENSPMDFVVALVDILLTVGIAFLLGWTNKKVESPTKQAFIWIGAILALLALRIGWRSSLLVVLLALQSLEHNPLWILYAAGLGLAGFVCWYIFNLMGNSIIELSQDLEQTKNRIALMELSFKSKLDAISSRFPENPEGGCR